MALSSLRVAPPKQPVLGSLTPRLSSSSAAALEGSLVIGRKRSCPSFYSDGQLSSGVTPKFSVLSRFSPSTPTPITRCAPVTSPLLRSPSLGVAGGGGGGGGVGGGSGGGGERGGKRARWVWEIEEFHGLAGVAQGVR